MNMPDGLCRNERLAELLISALGPVHNMAGFQCGNEALDRYLLKQARQDIRRRISRVFVATSRPDPKTILGFYTLSALAIELSQLPTEIVRKLPCHPIPAALIGRLAVTRTSQRRGIGSVLLADAIRRTLAVSDQIAIYAMVVDAANDDAAAFYGQFGFKRIDPDELRLFLPLKSIQ